VAAVCLAPEKRVGGRLALLLGIDRRAQPSDLVFEHPDAVAQLFDRHGLDRHPDFVSLGLFHLVVIEHGGAPSLGIMKFNPIVPTRKTPVARCRCPLKCPPLSPPIPAAPRFSRRPACPCRSPGPARC